MSFCLTHIYVSILRLILKLSNSQNRSLFLITSIPLLSPFLVLLLLLFSTTCPLKLPSFLLLPSSPATSFPSCSLRTQLPRELYWDNHAKLLLVSEIFWGGKKKQLMRTWKSLWWVVWCRSFPQSSLQNLYLTSWFTNALMWVLSGEQELLLSVNTCSELEHRLYLETTNIWTTW